MILRRAIAAGLITICSFATAAQSTYKPPQGYVPDAETAIKIAVAVWEPIYGRDEIANQKPYKAVLENGVWIVTGSLPPDTAGGVALAEICKDSGEVVRVIHGK